MDLLKYTGEIMGIVAGAGLAVFSFLDGELLVGGLSLVVMVLSIRIIQLRVDNKRLRNRRI